jgi:multicomponent Na+:H+ antiporter subunit E
VNSGRDMPLFFVLLLIWMLMSGSLQLAEWVVGALAALLVVALSRRSGGAEPPALIFSIGAGAALLHYLWIFLRALIRANLDMARRVLSPSLPIDPVVVEVHTHLDSSLGRLLLANSITLTPGTLTVDIEGERLRVHWIDRGGLDGSHEALQQATREIAEPFERALRGFLR